MTSPLETVAVRASACARADADLLAAMRDARESGASLREIADAATGAGRRMSHVTVRDWTERPKTA